MRELLRRHHISFKHAIDGILWAGKTQPNFRVHLLISALVLLFGYILRVNSIEWSLLVFTILLGVTVEMINTAIEAVTDLVTTEWRQNAKIAKDVSAGMMLIVSFGAVIVGLLIFGPKIAQNFY